MTKESKQARNYRKFLFASLAVMILTSFVSYGQVRPANSTPSTSGPRQLSIAISDNTTKNQPQNISTLNAHLNSLSNKGILTDTDTDYIITSEHISSLSGIHHIYYRQAINGIEVLGTEASVHIATNGDIFRTNDRSLLKDITPKVKSSANSFTALQAIQSITSKMSYGNPSSLRKATEELPSGYQVFTDYSIADGEILAKKAYLLDANNEVRLIWEVVFPEKTSASAWNYRIDAATGEILEKFDLTVSCNILGDHDHSNHSLTENTNLEEECDDSLLFAKAAVPANAVSNEAALMIGTYNVYALPIESPFYGNRSVVVDPADGTASPFGWHDTNGVVGAEFTNTRGNNTHTYEDIANNNDLPGDPNPSTDTPGASPDGGTSLTFDYAFELEAAEASGTIVPRFNTANRSLNAASTNTFYWTNIIHDIAYQYGFDEASGNFQENNYGNGGAGSDSVNAETQDGGSTCNANFFPPADGTNARMQMYICDIVAPGYDGAYDNLVIVHEYAHGISIRLTGGGANSGSLNNTEQMGEGWSDFYGYMLTMSADNFNQDRAVGTFLFGGTTVGGINGAGIREAPYTADGNAMGANSLTHASITAYNTANGPHQWGTVWATFLYDLTQALMDEHGFDPDLYTGTGGNNIALALVTEGLKLQPSSPGFVDGRDAILAADQALYGGANECLIWAAFANRGLGFSAIQGSTNSLTDNTNAFDVPPITLAVSENNVCLANGAVSLGGGIVSGGTYSGPGVSDDGNGSSFTFDPVTAGVGVHTITYVATDCTGTMAIDTDTITVTEVLPEISNCPDVTLALGVDGTATYDPFIGGGLNVDMVGGNDPANANMQGFTLFFVPGTSITQTTTVSFDWELVTAETDLPGFDSFGYLLGDTVISLSPDVAPIESGTFSIDVPAGQNFGFGIITADNTFGAATATVSNFSPGYSGQFETANWQELNQMADGTAGFSGTPTPSLVSCGDITTTLSQSVFTCLDIGTTTPVTVTVTDSLGNTDTCVANVTITGGALNTTTFAGGAWNNGDPTGTSMAIINDEYDTANLGDINACSCQINTNQTVTVRDGDFMNIAGNIVVDGTLIVENEGSVVQIDENAITTNNGTIEVQKTTPLLDGTGFVVLSSPMTGETRNGVFQSANRVFEIQPDLFTPHPDVTTAINFIDENFDYFAPPTALESGRGYLVFPQAPQATTSATLDHTYSQGTLHSGTIDYPLEYNGPTTENNFNVVGNPYASAIDSDMLISTNAAINQIYYWEHLTAPSADNPGDNTTNHSMDDISVYNLMGGIAAVNGGSVPGQFMVSGQGFGVVANQAEASAPLTFTNAMRVSGNNGTVRSAEIEINKLWLSVTNQAETLKSTALIGFTPEATAAIDAGYDSQRLDASINIFSTTAAGDLLGIQAREAFDSAIEIGIGFSTKITENETYTISIDQLEGISLENTAVFLIDNELQLVTNLKESEYSFTASESIQTTRFTVVFEEQLLQVADETSLDNDIRLFPNPAKNEVTLFYTGVQTLSNVTIVNLNGKIVSQIDLNNFNQSRSINVSHLANGVYFVRVESNSNAIVKRLIIN